MMISVTLLSTYLYCPRKIFLEKVLKITKPPKEVMVKGTVRHHAYDGISKSEERIVRSIAQDDGHEEIFERYRSHYFQMLKEVVVSNKASLSTFHLSLSDTFKEVWPHVYVEARERARNVNSFKSQTGYFGDVLWERLTPKIMSEMKVESGSLGIRGIIDQVQAHEDGSLVPYELKTGRTPEEGVWPGHRFQIGAYILLLREKSGKRIDTGYIRYLDSDACRPITMNPFLRDEIIKARDDVLKILSSKEAPDYVEEKSKCISCEFRAECYSLNKQNQ